MRTFGLFALTLASLAALVAEADAGPFRRGRARGNDCCPQPVAVNPCCPTGGYGGHVGYGGYGQAHGGYGVAANPCCDSAANYGGYHGGYASTGMSGHWSGGQWMGGQEGSITTTDGRTFIRGADGSYYSSTDASYGGSYPGAYGTTMGGWTTQPYYGSSYYGSSYYGSPYRSGYYGRYPGGVYPASGYYGSYPGYYPGGVYPASGTQPLTMPGVTLPGGVHIGPGGITIPGNMPPNR
jgi:hypothetical protein